MYKLNINSKEPLHSQLFKELKNDILNNLNVGDKLPSIRKMISTYNISKTTVENAYSQLYAEGYIDSYPKSGYFVSDIKYKEFEVNNSDNTINIREKKEIKYDFAPAQHEKDLFPLKTFKRVLNRAINKDLDFGKYSDGQGEEGLRIQISNYLKSSRGVNSHYDQLVITSGFSESLSIVARLFQDKFSTIATENPGYDITRKVFETYKYSIKKIDVNENGIDIDKLYNSDARLVYITPSHQYPKGSTIPISNRLKLLKWAKKKDGYILEDDYDSELNYINKPIPSLQGLDTTGRVIYFGTFSKSLSPALRVSYLVLPVKLAKQFQIFFDINFSKVSLPIQKAMEIFLQEGHYDRYLRNARTLNKKKHNLMKECLKKELKDTFYFESLGAGLSININPQLPFDMKKFKSETSKEKINIFFASNSSGGDWEAVRVGFGGFTLEEIPKAVKVLSTVWFKCLI